MARQPEDPGKGFSWQKRSFLMNFVRPFAPEVANELPPNATSSSPPSNKKVIPFEPDNRGVLALLGPLAMGEPAAEGYRLRSVTVEEARIRVVFERGEALVELLLTALDDSDGTPRGTSTSLRLIVGGSAPETERHAIADRVLVELKARDRGQIWRVAGNAGTRR